MNGQTYLKGPGIIETEEKDGVFCPKFPGPIYHEPEKKPDYDSDPRRETEEEGGLTDLID